MTYLVDANVLSEPTKPEPDERVVAWLEHHERELVVDPVILGELRFGILLLPRSRRRRRLERWFDHGIGRIHCLRQDAALGLRWAQLLADLREAGRSMPVKSQGQAKFGRSRLHGQTDFFSRAFEVVAHVIQCFVGA